MIGHAGTFGTVRSVVSTNFGFANYACSPTSADLRAGGNDMNGGVFLSGMLFCHASNRGCDRGALGKTTGANAPIGACCSRRARVPHTVFGTYRGCVRSPGSCSCHTIGCVRSLVTNCGGSVRRCGGSRRTKGSNVVSTSFLRSSTLSAGTTTLNVTRS